ncbi:RNF213 [Mytilus coruscus]|uniref:RNF213 n=1 Tax=Mytilus coruscus TaxID=42192 RepID=A0A6J8EQX2_MYTCO|nr:RNF213 [Mytilus coruscus]
MTGGQPKLDHAVIDKTKSEQSTETKTNEENNRNQNETFDITDGNQSSLQMPTGDLDTEKKDKKADEQSDRKRKDIKDNDTAGVLKSIVDDKEESFSSDFVAEKQFNSQSELNESENGTEKVKPPVSDSQLIEKVEGKTESGLEEQTLAEKPGISPPATGESDTENNNDRQLVHSSHNLNDTEKDETETKPFEAENTDESLIAGNVSSEKNEKHESEQEEAESTDDNSSSYQSADDEFQQASNAGSEIMLSKESKDDVKEGDASQDHQKKGPKQKSSTKLKREKKKDRKRKKLDREKETEDELVEGGKTHQHTNIDTKTALVKKETEENKEIVKPQDKIENKQLATAEALKEGAIGTSGECTTNTDNESDNIGKEKQNSESEIGKGEEINSREQEVSQNQKEKNDKHNAEEQETEDKASKSESESDDTSEEDTETTESPKKKPKVKTKVVNKNDGQRKNAAAQTQDANNPGTKPGNKNNKESETNSTKQKTSSDQASKTRNTMNSSNRGKSISTFIVNFHASLHAAFYIKPCKIYVRFGLDNLGGWKSVAHEMHIVGEYKNGNVKLGASVSIPRGCLNNSITYRYCIVYDDKQEIEEFIYNNPISTRYLYVLASELKQMGDGIFHQYNGVIRGPIEGKGIANYLWKLSGYDDLLYKKELLNDLHFSAHILLPVLPASSKSFEGSTGEEFAMLVCLVRSGLLTCYRDYCSDTEFDKIFFEALYSTFDSLVSDLHAKRDLKKKEDRIKVLVSAVTEIYLIDEYKLAISDDERNILCRTLLPECSQGNSCCPDVESLRDAFPSSFQKMRQAIINFVEPLTKKHGNLNWIYSMPLIHFLCGQCTPGEKPTEDFRHDQSAKWWGHASDDRLYWFDLKSQKEKIFDTTLVACLRLEQLPYVVKSEHIPCIPPDVILASVCFFIKTEKVISKNDKKETAILECLTEAIGWNNIEDERSVSSLTDAHRSFKISSTLLHETFYRKDKLRDIVLARTLEACLISMDLFYKKNEAVDNANKSGMREDVKNCLDTAEDITKYWLRSKLNFSKSSELLGCLKAWDRILNIGIPEGEVKVQFTKCIVDCLHNELRIQTHEEELVKVYCQNQNVFCDKLLEVLTYYAFAAVEECGKNITILSKLDEKQMKTFGALLSSVFEKKYEKENIKDQKVLLQISTTWTPFPLYIKMIFNNIHGTCLSERCKRLLHSSLDCVREITVTLLEGNILVKNLLLVQEKEDAFSSIIKEMRDFDYQTFQKAVEVRTTEYNAFRECERNLKRFIDLCHRCEANTLELEQQIGKYQDIDKTVLTDICSTVDLKKDIKKYKPKIIAFEIDRNILALLPEIIQCSSKGSLFLAIWERYGTQIVGSVQRALDITEIIDQVWKPAHQEWKTFVKRLKNGDILFKEFDSICGRSNQDTLRKEFQILEGGKDATWIKQRIDQMEKFRNLENYVKGAETIMKVVKEFQLEGNFKPIEQILNMTKGGKNFKMNKLKPALFRPCQVLSNIDNQKTKCLVKFIKSKPLIDWLRDSMPEGIKELKVFVDLAYISTGDDGMEIAKVTCFQSAAIGYAPLIFNLDAKCGYKDFLERCEEVWKALDSNPKLPKQLESTCQQLEWLKIVEQSHGSVEVTSLAQAEAINSSGIYHIGVLPSKNEQQQLELSDVLELQVMEKQEGQYLRRNYSFDQLHDLQSRLMLVAGKAALGKDDVDRFTLILDAVVRLCKIYIKLLSSGCVLFSKFHVMFRCDAKSATCAFVSFGEAENKHTIRGKVDEENKDVSFFVPKIAKFLEQCHDRWLEFIDNKREVEYILNFFTIEQMVILQQELVKLGSRVEVSNLIYPLLSIIKRDCTREDLVEAMEDARIELEQIEVKTEEEEEENQMEESSVVAKAKFIVEIVEAGYPEVLAKAALNDGCDPTMVDEGIAWCIEHETDYIEDELSTNEGEEKPFLGWQFTREISLSNVRAELLKQLGVDANSGIDNSVNTLIANLDKLWTTFIKSISSSVCDYLSVEHLALILRKLADKDDETIDRSFAICGCKEGIPNLIICPQSEMYNTVLSLYSTEEDSPLPLSDEVLLCTPCTTLDMLEIFWRRALFSDVNKIHCLVNADLLDYEVSDKGEKSLERHMKTANNRDIQYKLVVICSTENEYKSRMVAALDKYRIPQIAFGGEAHVKEYVSKSFIMENKDSRVDPASSVDFNRSSVRVVKSWRAGVGKSLFKRNMVAALQREQGIEVCVVSIPLYDQHIVVDEVMEVLLEHTNPPHVKQPRIFHIDISHEVQEGADAFLFQLLVLGCLSHSSGNVWRRSDIDYYIIESMPLLARDSDTQAGKLKCMHHCLDILPDVLCRSPKESLEILDQNLPKDYHESDLVFDETEFTSAVFQRPFQYLRRLDEEEELADINLEEPEGDKQKCLVVLLRHCGVRDPSWSELYHFVSFLNRQLQDFETSSFCNPIFLNDLPGFRSFVLKFMIQMSRDFATRSLLISEESPADMLKRQLIDEEDEDDIEQLYVMRRTWETSPHPYLFFNPDHHTVTFLGFNIQRNTGNLIDEQTKELLQERIMEPTFTEYQRTLYNGLESQHVNLSENFDELTRGEKIEKLCQVMGIEFPHDPDETYELTTDNVKKMLAIYMRFRCDIPVIIMGKQDVEKHV